MNQEQLTSLVRQMLLVAGGGLISGGYITQGSWTIIAGGLATVIVTGAWAIYTRRTSGLVASAAATLPPGGKIITDQATADAVPSSKVVGPAGV